MIVVSDTSPLNVLVRIGHVEVLGSLFGVVLIPPAVAAELSPAKWSEEGHAWALSHPALDRIAGDSRERIYTGRSE